MLFVVIIVQIMAVFVVGQLTVHFGANTRVEYRVSPNNQKEGILYFNKDSKIHGYQGCSPILRNHRCTIMTFNHDSNFDQRAIV